METVVYVDQTIEEFVPAFLRDRRLDVQRMKKALSERDFKELAEVSAFMKESGSSFGFKDLMRLALGVFNASKSKDLKRASGMVDQVERYLETVRIVYVPYSEENALDFYQNGEDGL